MSRQPADGGSAPRRRPGRPRDEDLDGRILEAALGFIDSGLDLTVNGLVARSGVSRAALYRRWPSVTDLLVAALDVGRSTPPEVTSGADLRHEIVVRLLGSPPHPVDPGYPEQRFRQRIRLMMADRSLQQAYWSSHVSRRREPLERAFRAAMARGVLRPDLDTDAAMDLLTGVAYYQLVVRGETLDDAAVRARVIAAIDIVWRGMLAG